MRSPDWIWPFGPGIWVAALLLLPWVGGGPAWGAGHGAVPSDRQPWHMEADQLHYYFASRVLIGQGRCEVWRGDLHIRADTIRYSIPARRIWASGGVVITMGGDRLTGSRVVFDLNTRTGRVDEAHLFLERNNVHVVAQELEKRGPEEYHAREAIISTCPLPRQAWSLKARTLDLRVNGVAVGRGVSFRVRSLPVLYSPWAAVPLNRARRSGFLLPHFASSSRNGVELILPLFWTLGDSADLTLYGHPMSRRGWMQGVEFRYALSRTDRGVFRYNVLVDRLDDNDFNHDGDVRSNEKRWWLRAKADQHLPLDFQAKLDLDLISDRDYLLEFRSGPMAYSATNRLFRKLFHRSLADDTDLIRPSTFQLTRRWSDLFLGGGIRYNDNQVPGEQDRTVQTLPVVDLVGFQRRLGPTPLFYDFNTSYVSYLREEGVKEQRLHLEPGVHLPMALGRWADLKMEGRLEETLFVTGGSGPEVEGVDNSRDRTTLLFRSDLTTRLARTFRWGGSLLRHSLRPRLRYEYRPFESQGDLPAIDPLDRLPALNRVTFSLLSFLTSRRPLAGGRRAYSDLLRFKAEESYDIREAGRHDHRDRPRRPFSDLYMELEYHPNPISMLRYDTTVNMYGRGVISYNLWGRLASRWGNSLSVDYRYNKVTDVNEINLATALRLSPRWTGTFGVKRSLEHETTLESDYGLRYQSGCWAVRAQYSDNQDQTSFMIHLELLGMGRAVALP